MLKKIGELKMERMEIERYLDTLGFHGEGKELIADALEIHRAGLPMMKLYSSIATKRGFAAGCISSRIRSGIFRAWKRQTEEMTKLFPVYSADHPPKNRTMILVIERKLRSGVSDGKKS